MLKLFEHQKKGIELLSEHNSFGLFWEMGTCKTLTVLIHLSNLVLAGEVKKILWLAPKSALGAVSRDLEFMTENGLGYRVKPLREALMCINYEKLSRKTSKHRKIVDETIFDALVLDEAHCVARNTSNRSKYIIGTSSSEGLVHRIPYRYAMTGTPVTNSRLEDFWSFLMLAKGGNYYNYRSFEREYLKTKMIPTQKFPVKVVSGYKNAQKLLNEVASYTQSVTKEEALDLPEIMPDNVIRVDWKPGKNSINYKNLSYTGMSTKAIYKEALNENIIEATDEVFDNALVRVTRLRQIAAGHLKFDGETIMLNTEKIDYAMELVENNHRKTVIFYDFMASFNALSKALEQRNIPYLYLNGLQSNKDIWKDFQKASEKECRVFLAQYNSANAGIDLYTASDTIYYEPCRSSTVLDQSRSRTHRNGVSRACTFTFLLTKDSIEEDIYERLQSHEDFNEKLWIELKKREAR